MDLCLGITAGAAQGTICSTGDQTGIQFVSALQVPYIDTISSVQKVYFLLVSLISVEIYLKEGKHIIKRGLKLPLSSGGEAYDVRSNVLYL